MIFNISTNKVGVLNPTLLFYFYLILISLIITKSFSKDLSKEEIIEISIKEKIYENPIWKHLIHYNGKSLSIKDKNFILSYDDFSLEQELIKTINLIYEDKEQACRFPARIFFIKTVLGLPEKFFSFSDCKDFIEYESLAPSDYLYLVFASENVKDPTSMMGHVFFKFSGTRFNGESADHAISFFAVLNNTNIASLMVEAFFTGLDGIFSLSPYRKAIKKYLLEEDRNIWEFELDLNDFEKKVIRYHIFELKYVKPKYFFVSYNCATVVYEILLLSEKFRQVAYNEKNIWVTPQDIVKIAYKSSTIKKISLIPSYKWKIRLLSDKIKDKSCIGKNLNLDISCFENLSDQEKYFTLELMEELISYLYLSDEIKSEQYQSLKDLINKRMFSKVNLKTQDLMNSTEYKSPVDTLGDSQIHFGFTNFFRENFFNIKILPAYSRIYDINIGSFKETAVSLFETSLLFNHEKVALDYIRFFETINLVPWNKYIGGFSSKNSIGLENHLDKNLNNKISIYLNYGLGQTFKFGQNYYYFLINGGIGYRDKAYIYAEPNLGAIIYFSKNLKTILNYSFVAGQFTYNNFYHVLSLSQSIFIKNNFSMIAEFKYFRNKVAEKNITNISLVFFF